MHKLASAALVTAAVSGVGALVVTASRTDAHAVTHSRAASKTSSSTSDHAAGALCNLMEKLHGGHAKTPSLHQWFAAPASAGADNNDCAAVGDHLADLQDDATHGPEHRADEESHETCSGQYKAICESENWSADRRSCVVAAGDLINAHLCAGQVPQNGGPQNDGPQTEEPANIPANLACSVLGPHVASTLQAGGFHEDVADLGDQVAAACEVGKWPLDLRQCFADATAIDALKACIHVVDGE